MAASSRTPVEPAAPVSRAATAPIPFIDLKAQQDRIRARVDRAVARVLDHGQYIMGPEVGQLEKALAAYTGAKRAIAVVKYLISQGVAPKHLVAAGFGEFQPLDVGTSEDAKSQNRRIELKLTER